SSDGLEENLIFNYDQVEGYEVEGSKANELIFIDSEITQIQQNQQYLHHQGTLLQQHLLQQGPHQQHLLQQGPPQQHFLFQQDTSPQQYFSPQQGSSQQYLPPQQYFSPQQGSSQQYPPPQQSFKHS
ncbi:28954_t:CDS:1, partial [Racocetra persica]